MRCPVLEGSTTHSKANRRVIFFCACEFPRFCHRHIVANLLIKEADRTGQRIRITEWPGGAAIRSRLRVTEEIYKKVCGIIMSVPADFFVDFFCHPYSGPNRRQKK